MLTAEERRELLADLNRTACDYPQTTIHGLFEAQAIATPDAIAIWADDRDWSYTELDRRASALAGELRRAGAGRGDLVAVAMERSPETVAGLLAVLKTGAAYLPLDPDLPHARLAWLLEDARPAVILADEAALAKLPASDARVVVAGAPARADEPALAPDALAPDDLAPDDLAPDDLAYVLYTSGSTGRPKAVEIRHRSVVNLLTSVQAEIGFEAADTLLAVTTLSFDIAALEIFLPLISGARLVVAGRRDAADPVRLAALMDRSGCTVMQATPATWRGLIAGGWSGNLRLKILCGGEALPRDLAAELLERGGAVWNLYGPTETTIWSMIHRLSPQDDPVPIGRPLANTEVYLLDRGGEPVPLLAAGELMIGGDGLARGYRGDPELTAQRFTTFGSVRASKLYRTGDVARRRGDGTIEFLGRTDNQVKIRGFRVGLEEVEAAIARVSGVSGCAVSAQPDASGEASLIAYVAGEGLEDDDIARLRATLSQNLPAYMVPTRFVTLPALPLTPNGKIDRKRLPEPSSVGAADPLAPRDETESRLMELWKEVLGLSSVGVEDNFFDLGGHSLLAAMLVAKIQASFGQELPLVALFQSPTIASLALALRSMRAPQFSHLVPLRRGSGRPLFIVHGIFGNVIQLKDLAERLTTSRAIYALQARGVDLRLEPHASVDEMVEAYAAAISRVQPTGPYALAGHSFGGLIAFEIARRFRARGEQVELVALMETDVSERCLPLPDKLAYGLVLARRVSGKLAALPVRQAPAYLFRKVVQL
jgi:amino acid adenylation domain-containing protein